MPKEQINYPSTLREIIDLETGEVELSKDVQREPTLSVHWSRDMHVQISVEYDIEALRQIVASHDRGDFLGEADYPNRVKLYTPDLGRADLQRLIRVTKRARNDVHGADE